MTHLRDVITRKKEFVLFLILSVIGLGINEIILLMCSTIYDNSAFLTSVFGDTTWFAVSKVIATAIVMVYNFITRKIFLEQKA